MKPVRWLLVGIALAVVVSAGFLLTRSGRNGPAEPTDEWVTAATVEDVEERYVYYAEEHELFVATLAGVPEGFVALSALIPEEEDGRMLYCTVSNLFENAEGDVYDRTGHPLEGDTGPPLAQIPLRVRDGVIEVAPSRAIENDLDRFGGPLGPPCGEWGEVVEGPPGYALATDAPANENHASMDPSRVKVGQRAELHFAPGPQASGLRWDLYQLQEDGLWQWRGLFVGGPGYESTFDIAPLEGGGIDDIGFGGKYSMDIEIPKLEPGRYRLVTDSIKRGNLNAPLHERYVWHYAEFEVVAE